MIREKTSEYFKILKQDKKNWYDFFKNEYRITNLRFINMYMIIERNLKDEFNLLGRPVVDRTYQEWNKSRVQLKSDLNYLLDHLKGYFNYYEGDHMILFFGGVGKNDFYYIETNDFFYIGIDVVGFYKKNKNFNMHLPILVEVLKSQFKSYKIDELKFMALKVIQNSRRGIGVFNKEDLPINNYTNNYMIEKYGLNKKL